MPPPPPPPNPGSHGGGGANYGFEVVNPGAPQQHGYGGGYGFEAVDPGSRGGGGNAHSAHLHVGSEPPAAAAASSARRVMFADPQSAVSAVSDASEVSFAEEDDSSEDSNEELEFEIPDAKNMGPRTGVQESLHDFLRAATDMYPSDRIFHARARRLTISDDKFRMMHLLKYPHLSEALASMVCFLCTFWLGSISSRAVWYKYAPTIIHFGDLNNESSHRFPPSAILIGPEFVYYGEAGGADYQSESLASWMGTACDAKAMDPWHKFYNWTRQLAVHSPVMKNLTEFSGCVDYNQVSCRRMELQNQCPMHVRRGDCPWTCQQTCQRNHCGLGCHSLEEFQAAWCDYREQSVAWLRIFRLVFKHSMIIISFSVITLILFKFNRLVVTICVVVQLTISLVLGMSLFYLSFGHPSSEHDHDQFLAFLSDREEIQEPLYQALNQCFKQTMKHGIHLASGFGMLWIGWGCLMIGSFSALAWWGQVFACGQTCSVPSAVSFVFRCGVWCVLLVPMQIVWTCFGRCLGIPTCDSTWNPPEFGTPHKALGAAREFCCCCIRLPHWIGGCVADFQCVVCHFMRTLEWNGFLYIGEVASDFEQAALKRHGVVNPNVQNYLAWRRSVLIVSIGFGVICLPFKPYAVMTGITTFREMGGLASGPNTYDEFRLQEAFESVENPSEDQADSPDEYELLVRRLTPKTATPLDLIVADRQLELLAAQHPAWHAPNGTATARLLLSSQQAATGEVADARDVDCFIRYLTRMSQKGTALLQKGSQEISIYGSVIDSVTQWSVVGMVAMAHSGWIFLPSSRHWVLGAWVAQLFSPFLISLVPASFFIDTADFETLLTQVLEEVILFASLDAAVADCWESVNSGVSSVGTFHNRFQVLCNTVHRGWVGFLTPNAVREEVIHACDAMRLLEDNVNWQTTEHTVRNFCSGLQSLLIEGTGAVDQVQNEGTTPAPSGWSWGGRSADATTTQSPDAVAQELHREEANRMIRTTKQYIISTFTLLASVQFAAGKIFALIPCVLALCPALIMASYKFRLLMPHSTMPVMFMLVLPLLYCPLTWIQYSIVIQIVPEPYICFGIGLQCFGQLTWSVMVIVYDYHEPFSRPLLNRVLKQMGAIILGVTIFTYVFIVVGALRLLNEHDYLDQTLEFAQNYVDVNSYDLAVTAFQLVCDVIFKLWLSKVAAYDFIVLNITAEYEYEHAVRGMRHRMKDIPDELWQDAAEREKLDKIQKILDLSDESWDSLNALVELDQHGDLSQFQDDGRL